MAMTRCRKTPSSASDYGSFRSSCDPRHPREEAASHGISEELESALDGARAYSAWLGHGLRDFGRWVTVE
jgi:hypothetical protein